MPHEKPYVFHFLLPPLKSQVNGVVSCVEGRTNAHCGVVDATLIFPHDQVLPEQGAGISGVAYVPAGRTRGFRRLLRITHYDCFDSDFLLACIAVNHPVCCVYLDYPPYFSSLFCLLPLVFSYLDAMFPTITIYSISFRISLASLISPDDPSYRF